MKKCNRCLKEYDESNFYKSSQAKDGLYTLCKACCKERDQNKRKDNPDWHQKQILRARKYQAENREKVSQRKKRYLQTPKGREVNRQHSKVYKSKYPEKIKSQSAVYRAVKKGNLFKPSFCTICGRKGQVEAHHASYEYEDQTIVTWVCKNCHTIIERKIKHGTNGNI